MHAAGGLAWLQQEEELARLAKAAEVKLAEAALVALNSEVTALKTDIDDLIPTRHGDTAAGLNLFKRVIAQLQYLCGNCCGGMGTGGLRLTR